MLSGALCQLPPFNIPFTTGHCKIAICLADLSLLFNRLLYPAESVLEFPPYVIFGWYVGISFAFISIYFPTHFLQASAGKAC